MNRLTTVFCVLVAIVASFGFTKGTQADNIWHDYSIFVGGSMTSGAVAHWGSGENAICTSITESFTVTGNPAAGEVFYQKWTVMHGYFGDPTIESRHYDLLETMGMVSTDSASFTNLLWTDGILYQYGSPVNIESFSTASLWRDNDHTFMTGNFSSDITGQNAIPIEASGTLSTFEDEEGVVNYQLELSSTWKVTTTVTPVPAPGTFMLLFCGGLSAMLTRRRRG